MEKFFAREQPETLAQLKMMMGDLAAGMYQVVRLYTEEDFTEQRE